MFYFLLIRPQQTAQKKLKTRLAALRRGDKVVTGGGLVGVVQRVKDGSNEVEIEIGTERAGDGGAGDDQHGDRPGAGQRREEVAAARPGQGSTARFCPRSASFGTVCR